MKLGIVSITAVLFLSSSAQAFVIQNNRSPHTFTFGQQKQQKQQSIPSTIVTQLKESEGAVEDVVENVADESEVEVETEAQVKTKINGAANCPVEDLELTRQVILGHIDSVQDTIDDDDDDAGADKEKGAGSKKGIRKRVLNAVQRITPFKY